MFLNSNIISTRFDEEEDCLCVCTEIFLPKGVPECLLKTVACSPVAIASASPGLDCPLGWLGFPPEGGVGW